MAWNLADIFDAVAAVVPPDRPAIIQNGAITTWSDLDQRSNRFARSLMACGLQPADKVAIISRNHPAYIEAFIGSLKARMVPININYRYKKEEVAYIFNDARVNAVVYQREFEPLVRELQALFPAIGSWYCVEGESELTGGMSFAAVASEGDGARLDITRSGEDYLLLYTGGTTGMPKGVVWPARTYRACQLESPLLLKKPKNVAEHVALVQEAASYGRTLPACPLMHGAGLSSSVSELLEGGTAILLSDKRFNPEELWRLADEHQATRILIVGDVFARPMLRALDLAPGTYDLSRLRVISSAGLMWSAEVKQGLLRHIPQVKLVDILGASEASPLGYSVWSRDASVATGRFIPAEKTVLISDEGRIMGPDEIGVGLLARAEPLPAGYFGDPEKTAQTFRIIDGQRYAVVGDAAERFADGTMGLLGRGSLVINTGGEKVFVEEVEEGLKRLAMVDDALVVGLPDERWGSMVVALVTVPQGQAFDADAAQRQLRLELSDYKVPKRLIVVEQLPRADSGKADYKTARRLAADLITLTGTT